MALREIGVKNQIIRFRDGQETVDFLFHNGLGPPREEDGHYLLLLDLYMPKVNGIAVLRRIRQDGQLRRMPIVVLSTTDNPRKSRPARACTAASISSRLAATRNMPRPYTK